MRPPNDYSSLYWIKLVQWYQREDLWGQYQSNIGFPTKNAPCFTKIRNIYMPVILMELQCSILSSFSKNKI